MNARRLLARGTAVSVSTLVMAAGLTTSAWAGSASVVSGNPALNTGSRQLVIHGESVYVPQVPSVTVTLTRHGSTAPEDQIQTSDGTADNDTHTITATLDFTRANPGLYDVAVDQGSSHDSCESCLTVNAFSPVVTSVSPDELGKGTRDGGYQNFVINGQNFAKGLYAQCSSAQCEGPTVAVYRTGTTTSDPNVTLSQTEDDNGNSSPTPTTASTITLRVDVTEADSAVDYADDIVVTNSDGKSATCVGCLTIRPRPAVTSVDLQPTDFPGNVLHVIGQNAITQTVIVRGDNFPADAVVQFVRPDGSPSGQPIAVASASAPQPDGGHQAITLTGVDTTGVTTPGAWRVLVSSPSQHSASALVDFPVIAKPRGTDVDLVDSDTGGYGQGARQVRVDVFVDHTTPFYPGSGTTPHTLVRFLGLPAGAVVGDQIATAGTGGSDNVVRSTLDLPEGTAVLDYDLIVVNPDGGRSERCDNSDPGPAPPLTTAANTCDLPVEAGPRLDYIEPNTEAPGFAGNVDLHGSEFHSGSGKTVHVRVGPAAAPFFDGDVAPVSSTKVTVPISIPAGTATSQAYNVVIVNNDDKGSDTRTGLFHVTNLTAGHPTPSSGTNDGPVSVTLTGNNIAPDASVAMVMSGVSDIPGTGVVVGNGGTSLTATFDLTNRAPGFYDVLVTNPGSGANAGTGGCAHCFDVQTDAPSISGVSPQSMGAGAADELVTITGDHIFPGATPSFTNPHIHLVGPATVTPPGTLAQHISIDEGTDPDSADSVTVTNTDEQTSNGLTFAVNQGPAASGITPTTRGAGSAPFQLTVTGSHIASGATLAFSVPSITATDYAVNAGGTSLTAMVTVPASVSSGAPVPVAVAVVNPDRGRGTSPTKLTVDPAPSIDHIDPAGVGAGTSVPVQIIGHAFNDDATVSCDDPGVTISKVHVVGPTEIDATVAVGGAETAGDRVLTVQNGDGGRANHSIRVFTAPGPPAAVIVRGGDGQLSVAWSPPTADGGAPISSYTARLVRHSDGGVVASTTVPGTGRSHQFTGLANGLRYDVTVVATNAAGNGPAATGHGRPKWVTTLTFHARRGVHAGDRVRLHGALRRSDGSAVRTGHVRIYRKRSHHHRHLVGRAVTGRRGHWALRYTPARTATLVAVYRGDTADRADRSPRHKVRVT